ncbi:hypothetical protein ACVWWO_005202 [Bradyrhizobium sp. F1.13.1]
MTPISQAPVQPYPTVEWKKFEEHSSAFLDYKECAECFS